MDSVPLDILYRIFGRLEDAYITSVSVPTALTGPLVFLELSPEQRSRNKLNSDILAGVLDLLIDECPELVDAAKSEYVIQGHRT